MAESKSTPDWKRFEKVVHGIHATFAPLGATVKYDDRIFGERSRRKTYQVELGEHLVLLVRGKEVHGKVRVTLKVERKIFFGPLPLERKWLVDARTGVPIFTRIATELINIEKMRNGQLSGWAEVASLDDLCVKPYLTHFTTFEAWGI